MHRILWFNFEFQSDANIIQSSDSEPNVNRLKCVTPFFHFQVYDCYDQTDEANCTYATDDWTKSGDLKNDYSKNDDSKKETERAAKTDTNADSPLKVYPAYQTVRERGTAVLWCEGAAARRPVRWFKQEANRMVELRRSANVDLSGTRLAIKSVALSDAAVYLCRGALPSSTNLNSPTISTSAVLSVQQGELVWRSNART